MRQKTERQLRVEVVRVCHLLYEKGFISATDGNVSARLEKNHILITPSGRHKGFLEPADLVVVDRAGMPLGPRNPGVRKRGPSSELPMHLEAYRLRPDIGAVVHAHPPITIALSIAGIPLADCLLPEVIVFLGLIPTAKYATPASEENIRAVRAFLGSHDALVLRRHGSLTVGDDPMQGFMRLETVEQNARVAFMLAQLGTSNKLPAHEVKKLLEQRRRMGLSRPGESEEFCEVCGVCHSSKEHAPTLRSRRASRKPAGRLPTLPDIREVSISAQQPLDPQAIREQVAQIVEQTLGKVD